MNLALRIPISLGLGAIALLARTSLAAPPPSEARVTQIIREVKLLPSNADERDAVVEDRVAEDTGVKTGGDSRSELTFADLTITRLGANTIFSFNKAGRTVNLDAGSVLLRVPKDSGGGSIRNNIVTVAITGTTVIFEANEDGGRRLIALEGNARVSFTNDPKQSRKVRAGQMLDVPPGATTLPMPVYIDLNELMRTHPLITDFRPLPSLPLIVAVAKRQPPPSSSGPAGPPPIVRAPPAGSGPTQPTSGGGGSGQKPPSIPTPRPITRPSPTPDVTPTATPKATPSPYQTPRASPSPKPSPTPKPSSTPRATPSPKPTPKPTPKATPRPKFPPKTNTTTKPPVVNANPTPTPTQPPVILRTAPTQTTPKSTPTPRSLNRFRTTTKKPTSGPR